MPCVRSIFKVKPINSLSSYSFLVFENMEGAKAQKLAALLVCLNLTKGRSLVLTILGVTVLQPRKFGKVFYWETSTISTYTGSH